MKKKRVCSRAPTLAYTQFGVQRCEKDTEENKNEILLATPERAMTRRGIPGGRAGNNIIHFARTRRFQTIYSALELNKPKKVLVVLLSRASSFNHI